MRIACLSDTHGLWLPPIPAEAEVIVHAGDIGPDRGAQAWFNGDFADWARDLKRPVLGTFGNHDAIGQDHTDGLGHSPLTLPENVRLVVDEAIRHEGVLFYFSPWSPYFGMWPYMDTETGLGQRYQAIPRETQVLVSHGPPKGYGDRAIRFTARPKHAGSEALLHRWLELPYCDTLVCGHIHEGMGTWVVADQPYLVTRREVINCSVVNEYYQPVLDGVRLIDVHPLVTETV